MSLRMTLVSGAETEQDRLPAAVTGGGSRAPRECGCAKITSSKPGGRKIPLALIVLMTLCGPRPCMLVTPCSGGDPSVLPAVLDMLAQPGTVPRGQLCFFPVVCAVSPRPRLQGRGLHFHGFYHLSLSASSPAPAPPYTHRPLASMLEVLGEGCGFF